MPDQKIVCQVLCTSTGLGMGRLLSEMYHNQDMTRQAGVTLLANDNFTTTPFSLFVCVCVCVCVDICVEVKLPSPLCDPGIKSHQSTSW